MFEKKLNIAIVVLIVAGVLFYISTAEEKELEPLLFFTQLPAGADPVTTAGQVLFPDYDSSRIARFRYKNSDAEPEILTPEFHSASSPSISFDNEQIVFSARPEQNDPWQIWLMNIDGSAKRLVFKSDNNALTPSFLPNGKIVFSLEREDPNIGLTTSLYTCRKDGSELSRITFHPHRDLYSSILHDGRIAMVSRQVYPEKKGPEFMVLRPDGTKAQVFYQDRSGSPIRSVVRETPDQKLVFIRGDGDRRELVSLSYADPGLPPEIIASYPAGGIQSADILDSGRLVVSTRSSDGSPFGISSIGFEGKQEPIFRDPDFHSVEPVAVRVRSVPKKLPSSISLEDGFGIMIGLDFGLPQMKNEDDSGNKYIRVSGLNRVLKEFETADDGSFYLKVRNDMPIRFQRLNAKKEVLGASSPWVWLRTNERRACLGCLSYEPVAPTNLVPEAIHKAPILITDSSGTDEASRLQAVRQVLNEKQKR